MIEFKYLRTQYNLSNKINGWFYMVPGQACGYGNSGLLNLPRPTQRVLACAQMLAATTAPFTKRGRSPYINGSLDPTARPFFARAAHTVLCAGLSELERNRTSLTLVEAGEPEALVVVALKTREHAIRKQAAQLLKELYEAKRAISPAATFRTLTQHVDPQISEGARRMLEILGAEERQ